MKVFASVEEAIAYFNQQVATFRNDDDDNKMAVATCEFARDLTISLKYSHGRKFATKFANDLVLSGENADLFSIPSTLLCE